MLRVVHGCVIHMMVVTVRRRSVRVWMMHDHGRRRVSRVHHERRVGTVAVAVAVPVHSHSWRRHRSHAAIVWRRIAIVRRWHKSAWVRPGRVDMMRALLVGRRVHLGAAPTTTAARLMLMLRR